VRKRDGGCAPLTGPPHSIDEGDRFHETGPGQQTLLKRGGVQQSDNGGDKKGKERGGSITKGGNTTFSGKIPFKLTLSKKGGRTIILKIRGRGAMGMN